MKCSTGPVSLSVTIVLAAGFLYTTLPSSAEGANPSVPTVEKKAGSESESHTANMGQAIQLVEYGRANKSATALVVAAQIVRGVTLTDDASRMGEKSAGGDAKGSKDAEGKSPMQLDADALLKEARELAGNDAVVIALIDQEAAKGKQAQVMKTRGRRGGAACARDRVLAGGVDYWPIDFRAGEYAQVLVIGDQDTDLDCYVFDQADGILVSDERYYRNCNMRWYTRYGGKFTIAVSNAAGRYHNTYRVCTD